MPNRLCFASTLVAVALWLPGGAAGADASVANEPPKQAADYIEDTVLTARVKSALLADRSIKAVDISVDTNRSEVALSGRVENEEQRRTALQIASSVQGVARVRDQLKVQPLTR
jgi:hyperosmotically inducible protein